MSQHNGAQHECTPGPPEGSFQPREESAFLMGSQVVLPVWVLDPMCRMAALPLSQRAPTLCLLAHLESTR